MVVFVFLHYLSKSTFSNFFCKVIHGVPVEVMPKLKSIYSTHTQFIDPFSGTNWVSRYQKDKTNLDFTKARDNEWLWYQLGHMQVCTSLQTDNHASIPPLSFLQAGCLSCCPTNSVRALKAQPIFNQFNYRRRPSVL